VEEGVAPPASTNYDVIDGQVIVPTDASQRRGIQPVVSLTANGDLRGDVGPGDALTLRATAQVPDDARFIVAVEWDFDGSGLVPVAESVEPAPRVVNEQRRSFAEPGTYFPTVRVVARRDGSTDSPYARVQNLGRVRVVVRDVE